MNIRKPLHRAALLMGFAISATLAGTAAHAQHRNCIDTLAGLGDASRFVGVVNRSHLVADFREVGPFTFFVPTNAAVAAVTPGLVNILFPAGAGGESSADPVLAPAAVNAHILDGRYTSAALEPGMTMPARTRAGNTIQVSNVDGKVTLRTGNGVVATVLRGDIPCSNGVIHIIDQSLVR
ncbi:fasciclin domain-containing protein [Falsiroseomonas tokyonensis]|uniref:Fasciclin domain-containing protein n=1 Tax=Falsiroseomonas tokyonensis TaxID=430521 RepID=A0ABV7BTA0_9PROT|nr:fasciclin domain-containing protein [Falsiroseomonas tokyonensis]MBU8537322.1 fasciclin domain-containing protein [Falsiroseomonas tokyonensis]